MPVRQIETPVRASNPPAPRVFHAGSLVYTKAALLTLMGWLLWGDFVFNFMEIVIGSLLPLQMRLLPHDRYAQLGSAAGIIISLGIMAAGVISGLWLEWMKARETVELFHYRYLPAWSALCILISLGFFLLLYREWKRLGGDQHYTAP